MSLKDKIIFVSLLVIIFGNLIWFSFSIFNKLTVIVPSEGGQYIEGIAGQPRYTNPLLASNRSELSITKLIYNGLFTYDSEGNLIPELAKNYEVKNNNKEYTINLKENVKWHDDKPFSANDVIFTINIIKNKDYEGLGFDNLRVVFENIDKVEKINENSLKFTLKESQKNFLDYLTVGILPEHAWNNVNQENFAISKLNQNPIGTGPFEFVSKDENKNGVASYTLRSYKNYHQGKPLINKVIFKFYPNQDQVVDAYKKGEVMAIVLDNSADADSIKNKNVQKELISLPIYFSVFFNQTKSIPLAYVEVREALSLATDRQEILNKVFNNLFIPMQSPLFKDDFGYEDEFKQKDFNLDEANKILDEKSWKKGDDGIRKKGDDKLEFSLHVNSDQKFYIDIAKILQEQWKKLGADVKIVEHNRDEFNKDIVDSRNFDAILEKSSLNFSNSDLFSLWYSGSGLNFAKVKNDDLDDNLKNLEKEDNLEKRKELYKKIQKEIQKENLTVFLFSPRFIFIHDDELKGFNVKKVNNISDYYGDIQNWYLKEKHILKKD